MAEFELGKDACLVPCAPTFSPDGTKLAINPRDGIRIFDAVALEVSAQLATAALDLPALAEISLTGGSIANIAVNAAFLAAAADRPLDMSLVLRAVRSELRKQGRPAFEADPRRGPR